MKIGGPACSAIRLLMIMIMLGIALIFTHRAYGTTLYKNYIIRQDRGREILCDPYVVKKDDWIYKLFRERGEIAQRDFPEFIRIFKRLNPSIHNVDIIRPGEYILIPLKKVQQNTLPGQATGLVSLPFVNISEVSELLKTHSRAHEVRYGDYVSRLVAREYGAYGTRAYREGIRVFRFLNPEVLDLDRIYPGQKLYIPAVSLREQPWYPSLFDQSGNRLSINGLAAAIRPKASVSEVFNSKDKKNLGTDPFKEAALIVEGKLFNHGTYYFPRPGSKNAALDLSKFPLIELPDGARVLFSNSGNIQRLDLDLLRSFWKKLSIAFVPPDADTEQILDAVIESNENIALKERLSFSENGVDVRIQARWILDKSEKFATGDRKKRYVCINFVGHKKEFVPETILNYLERHQIIIWDILRKNKGKPEVKKKQDKPSDSQTDSNNKVVNLNASDRRGFVIKLLAAMGYPYREDAFPTDESAEFQETTGSILITEKDDVEIVFDFGSLDDRAIYTLKEADREVVQLKAKDPLFRTAEKIFKALKENYVVNPEFLAARRPADYNIAITIRGFLLPKIGRSGILLVKTPLPDDIIQFLKEQGPEVVLIHSG